MGAGQGRAGLGGLSCDDGWPELRQGGRRCLGEGCMMADGLVVTERKKMMVADD